jgi:chromosome segregation ATPase
LVEHALYFAIGFLTAALAACVAAPLMARRAMRLALARARLSATVTEKQASAHADALRAEHAVVEVRAERKLKLSEERAQALRVEAGRQSVEITRLRGDVDDLTGRLHHISGESEALASRSRDVEATLGASQIALHAVYAQRDQASGALEAAETRAAELETEASRDRARIAVVSARAEYLEGRLEDLTRAANAAREQARDVGAKLEAERARATALEERLRGAGEEGRTLADQASRSAAERRDLVNRLASLEERVRLSERAREDLLLENGRRLAELADREAALTASSASAANLETRLQTLTADSHAEMNAAALRADTLGAAHAAMEGSLKAARSDREALQRENDSLRGRLTTLEEASRDDEAGLREAISRLGRDVVRTLGPRAAPTKIEAGAKPESPREAEPALASAGAAEAYAQEPPTPRAGRSRARRR